MHTGLWNRLAVVLAAGMLLAPVGGWTLHADPAARLQQLFRHYDLSGLTPSAIGVTRDNTPIPCLVSEPDTDWESGKLRVLLIGGLDGRDASVEAALSAAEWFGKSFTRHRFGGRFMVSCVPCANPDGWAEGLGEVNLSGGKPGVGYPPAGKAYNSASNPEAQYLWRWIGMHAPDLVVDVRAGEGYRWLAARGGDDGAARLLGRLPGRETVDSPDDLIVALGTDSPAGIGTIPALRAEVGASDGERLLNDLFRAVERVKFRAVSPARRELRLRVARTPLQVAEQMARHYGQDLSQVAYIKALAVIGHWRLAQLTGNDGYRTRTVALVEPWLGGGLSSLGKRTGGSQLSGHLVFGELARGQFDPRLTERVLAAANLGFDEGGRPLKSMPFHNEMSDSVFMGGPILAHAGRLTGEDKYFEMCLRHVRFMQEHCLREDGLYRHSPLDEAAWGRGNGFPALGLALCLSEMPDSFAGKAELRNALEAHLNALLKHQDPNGMWRQVIDRPESYRELTSTCMITFAMVRGIREGWLDEAKYRPAIDRAWKAIKTRVAPDGHLVDVCTGTGKQKNLRDYFDRTAILGRDDRGGAMVLMVSTELAAEEADKAKR